MKKENWIFLICGFLLGAIAGALFLAPLIKGGKITAPAALPVVTTTAPTLIAPPGTTSVEVAPVMDQIRKDLDVLKAAVAGNPRDFDALAQLGNMYMDARKFPQAIEFYEKALAVRYESDVATDLGISYRETGQMPRALATFQAVQKAQPGHWHSQFNQAIVLVDMNRKEEARALVAKMKAQKPADPDILRFEQALTTQ